MYNLFKLVRLISVKDEVNPVKIDCYAWRQHGESSLLALACSNSKLNRLSTSCSKLKLKVGFVGGRCVFCTNIHTLVLPNRDSVCG